MQDLKVGECRRICVAAEEAYGFYDLKKIVELSREELPPHDSVRVGDVVVMAVKDDGPSAQHRVIEIKGDSVTLDSNHPLAGQDLIFEIEATEVRDETEADNEDSDDDATSVAIESEYLH
jgi:FKBP-type peptidyl-prolyl cis-trans isomerase SlyD